MWSAWKKYEGMTKEAAQLEAIKIGVPLLIKLNADPSDPKKESKKKEYDKCIVKL